MESKDFKKTIIPMAERIYPMVVRMLGGHENAEDALQEIMIKLWNKRKKISKHPNIQALVFTTARNYCIDLIRKNKINVQEYHADVQFQNTGNRMDELEWKEVNTIIKKLLKELPEKQADILILRDLDGLEYHEIADLKGISIETTRVLLSRARKKIKEKLKTIYSYEFKEK